MLGANPSVKGEEKPLGCVEGLHGYRFFAHTHQIGDDNSRPFNIEYPRENRDGACHLYLVRVTSSIYVIRTALSYSNMPAMENLHPQISFQ